MHEFKTSCINKAVHASKEEVQAALQSEFGASPKYVFCHTESALFHSSRYFYYFYFENQEREYKALCKQPKAKVRALCNQIIRKNDPSGHSQKFNVGIEYLNEDKPPGYGFWRED